MSSPEVVACARDAKVAPSPKSGAPCAVDCEKYRGRGTPEDPFVVDWDLGDPENPFNWSVARKWLITLQASPLLLARSEF